MVSSLASDRGAGYLELTAPNGHSEVTAPNGHSEVTSPDNQTRIAVQVPHEILVVRAREDPLADQDYPLPRSPTSITRCPSPSATREARSRQRQR